MKYYTFEIVIEKESEDPGYFAYSPTLPGRFSNGATIEEEKQNIREAVQQHVASLEAHGLPIGQHEHLVHVEELTVGWWYRNKSDASGNGARVGALFAQGHSFVDDRQVGSHFTLWHDNHQIAVTVPVVVNSLFEISKTLSI